MKTFTKYFLRGLLALLPLFLTIYPLYYFFWWSDTLLHQAFNALFPRLPYITGSGIVLGLVAIFLLGVLMSSRFVRRIYGMIEDLFRHIPLVKTLYAAIKELTHYLTPGEGRQPSKVVAVKLPGQPIELIGFVMRNDLGGLPDGIDTTGKSAVYFPMSYQMGGYTCFIPRDWLRPLDISVEEAMRNTLMGWISVQRDEPGSAKR